MLRPLLVFLVSFAARAHTELLDETALLQVQPRLHTSLQGHSVQASWDNHFKAFGKQNVENIMLDYTKDSIVTVYDQTTGAKNVFRGLDEIRVCFTNLFKSLPDLSDLAAPVVEVNEAAGGEPGSVFLVWSCPASGYLEATDTFIFDKDSKILWQNVAFVYQHPSGDGSVVEVNDEEAPTGKGPVHDGWANHFAAFGSQNIEMILQDYTEHSHITVYNQADGVHNNFHGLSGVKQVFHDLFSALFDISDLAAPIIRVEEPGDDMPGQVFLIWHAASSGIVRATDTFIFDEEGKIARQNVVMHYENPISVQASWDNHFAAFGGQDVDKIMLDYTEDSVVTLYDQTTGAKTVFSGLDEIRVCFTNLFKSLPDLSDLAAPVIEVKEATPGAPGSVFLIWSCPASGYLEATDTFIFDKDSKILWQNVVVVYQDPNGDGSVVAVNDQEAPAITESSPVHDAWANHFAAFGSQNIEMILQDYYPESEITVYNHADGSQMDYLGRDGAKTLFSSLFEDLFDTSDLAAPIIHVKESVNGMPGQVFLIWRAPASGFIRATDTFIFDEKGRISRQHVVVYYKKPGPPPMCTSLVHYKKCRKGKGGPCPCTKYKCTRRERKICKTGAKPRFCAHCPPKKKGGMKKGGMKKGITK